MMREYTLAILALNASRARNYPDFLDESYFNILNIVFFQLNSAGTISFECHFLVLKLPLRIESLIILCDHFPKSINVTIKQSLSKPLKCLQELFF